MYACIHVPTAAAPSEHGHHSATVAPQDGVVALQAGGKVARLATPSLLQKCTVYTCNAALGQYASDA